MARQKDRRRREAARSWIDAEIAQIRKEEQLTDESWVTSLPQLVTIPARLEPNFAAYLDDNQAILGPDWAAALVLFEDYASSDGDPDRARVVYQRRLAGHPPCALIERRMGDVSLYGLGLIHRARRHYQAAAAAAPEHAPAHFQLGQVYHLLGVFDRAKTAWERAVATAGPGDEEAAARALFNLGVFLLETGAIGLGRRNLRRAIQFMPDYSEARAALARLERLEVRP